LTKNEKSKNIGVTFVWKILEIQEIQEIQESLAEWQDVIALIIAAVTSLHHSALNSTGTGTKCCICPIRQVTQQATILFF
jgi:hypothetical protein